MGALPEAYLKFGRAHAELVGFLEGLVGGNGPYGDHRYVFDSAATEDDLPDSYSTIRVERAREAVSISVLDLALQRL